MESKNFGRQLANRFFGRSDKQKVSKSRLEYMLELAYLSGQLNSCYQLQDIEKKSPTKDKDELLGELDNLFLKLCKRMTTKFLFKETSSIDAEDILKYRGNL